MKYLFSLLLMCSLQTVFAQSVVDAPTSSVERELIVELAANASWDAVIKSHPQLAHQLQLATAKAIRPTSAIFTVQVDSAKATVEQVLNTLRHHPEIKSVQRNAVVDFRTTPNDPDYRFQFGLDLIGAPQVWDVTTGGLTATGDTIVVAVLDSGFDVQHEDLRRNAWVNSAEQLDGIDNDGNGYVDDINGWDFLDETGDIGVGNHGTAVAGIIGASGNNDLGIAGINWNIKILYLRTKQVDHIIAAYEYIIEQRRKYNETKGAEGAFIVATNASFGIGRQSCTQQVTWGNMYDKLGAVGILTGSAADNSNYDVDERGDMPTTCTSEFLLTTTNINKTDTKHPSAAFGSISVDMGAPGQGSYSTESFDSYGGFDGSSAAAPHLTGSIALLYSLPCAELSRFAKDSPREAALLIKEALLKGVDPNESLAGITATGGRLNVFNSMVEIQNFCGVTTGELEIFALNPNPVSDFLTMTFETPDFEDYTIDVYNALGQLVYKEVIQPNRFRKKRVAINTSDLARGTYFLVLRSREKGFQTGKFIKM